MGQVSALPRAQAALGWAEEVARRDPSRGYVDGFGHGLMLALTLAQVDATWAQGTLDELFELSQRRLAERLAGTPVPTPSLQEHRMAVYGQVQEILRRTEV
jgi:hypothetical protein